MTKKEVKALKKRKQHKDYQKKRNILSQFMREERNRDGKPRGLPVTFPERKKLKDCKKGE